MERIKDEIENLPDDKYFFLKDGIGVVKKARTFFVLCYPIEYDPDKVSFKPYGEKEYKLIPWDPELTPEMKVQLLQVGKCKSIDGEKDLFLENFLNWGKAC